MPRTAIVQPSGNPVIRQHKKGHPRFGGLRAREICGLGDRLGHGGDRTVGRHLVRTADSRKGRHRVGGRKSPGVKALKEGASGARYLAVALGGCRGDIAAWPAPVLGRVWKLCCATATQAGTRGARYHIVAHSDIAAISRPGRFGSCRSRVRTAQPALRIAPRDITPWLTAISPRYRGLAASVPAGPESALRDRPAEQGRPAISRRRSRRYRRDITAWPLRFLQVQSPHCATDPQNKDTPRYHAVAHGDIAAISRPEYSFVRTPTTACPGLARCLRISRA